MTGGLIAVASPLLTELGSQRLTPAQRSAIWELAAVLDERRISAPIDPSRGDAVWVVVEARRLRGRWGRSDNAWLKVLLRRLEGIRLGADYGGDAWGGVMVAQWRISDGGRLVEILIPPAGLAALRAPETFGRIEAEAAHRLPPHARTLYGLLADKSRLREPKWRVSIAELKSKLGVVDQYLNRFDQFHLRVLGPATDAIAKFTTIDLMYELERLGRRVEFVIFRWSRKGLDAAGKVAHDLERHSLAAGKDQVVSGAPDLVPDQVVSSTNCELAKRATRWLAMQDAGTRIRWYRRAREVGAPQSSAAVTAVPQWAPYVAVELTITERL